MAIYRGPGGAGDATNDATSQAILAAESAQQAAASAAASAASASQAATSATNSASSATASSNSATAAASSANSASTSATNAANSATAAQTAQTAAELAETNAETAEANAETAEANATASAALAQDWATKTSGPVAGGEYSSKYNAQLAATSATNAANSATSASTSASAASTSATNAASSATAAASSASAASTSATNAANSATAAAGSATSAASSASTATTQASNAASSATAAATSASNAATSETNAANSASAASTSATTAANSATSASTSATNAANSATSAAASYDSFDDRYLGSKTSDPSVDNDGNALLTGALYWNSVANEMRVWGGSSWLTSYLPATGYVQKSGDTMTGTLNVPSLTSSGNVTLSGGTANGVAYLNGSKVLTTGSALTFDGALLKNTAGGLSIQGNGQPSTGYGWEMYNANSTTNYLQSYNRTGGAYMDSVYNSLSHQFWIQGSEQMRLTSTGLGIGTSSPTAKLTVDGGHLNFPSSAYLYSYGGATTGTLRSGFQLDGTNNLLLAFTNNTERMRIDSSGRVFIGTTSYTGLMNMSQSAGDWVIVENSGYAGTQYFNSFRYNGTQIGTITGNNTTTTYATSSDYRLKENIQPMQNALATVAQLNPVTYTWKADGSDGQGFIAHELQAVVPDCVTGEKDAVDEEGNPVYQGIDTSFLVATLTKAIQEQQEQIEQLKAEVAALKGV